MAILEILTTWIQGKKDWASGELENNKKGKTHYVLTGYIMAMEDVLSKNRI